MLRFLCITLLHCKRLPFFISTVHTKLRVGNPGAWKSLQASSVIASLGNYSSSVQAAGCQTNSPIINHAPHLRNLCVTVHNRNYHEAVYHSTAKITTVTSHIGTKSYLHSSVKTPAALLDHTVSFSYHFFWQNMK